jgi:succinoglycan biosynthesis transport protein ExoP
LTQIYLTPPSESDSPAGLPFDIGEYTQLLLRHWRVIAATCALAVAAALTHYFLTPKLYRAATIVQIEQRTAFPVGADANPWLAAWASAKYYPTQYRLLRSRGLAERVIRDLRLTEDPAFNPARSDFSADEATAAGDDRRTAQLAGRIVAGTEVEPIEGTELVEISYVSEDPDLAARVANGLVETFINWGIDTRAETVGRTSRFIDSEIESLREEIRNTEGQLQELSRSTNLITLDPETNLTLQRLERLNGDLAAAQKDRIEKEARLSELTLAPRESVAEEVPGSVIAELRRDLRLKENEYESKLQIYTPDWPEMIELRGAIDDSKAALEREIDKSFEEVRARREAEFSSARAREQRLVQEINKVKDEALDLSQASVEYNYLDSELSARKTLLAELLRERSETGMSARLSEQRESNVRVVDEALVPRSPFRPSLRLDLTFGLFFGLAGGVGIVLLRHFLDRTVKAPEELEKLVGLPVLGVIPDISENAGGYGYRGYYGYGNRSKRSKREADESDRPRSIELIPSSEPRLAVSEAYRSLRTALLLSSADELQVITITSAESSEGKTATASNLAIVMAQLGKRVLLVDADLRKPRLHKVLQTSNRSGLVNYLTGSASIGEILLETAEENLTFCPAGPHPPNPSELLASGRMSEFLGAAQKKFDLIIVDTPPVLAVTDAALPGSIGDGVVLCFRAHKILRADAKACKDRLALAGVKMLGVVLNRYQPRRSGSYGRKYHYYEAYAEEVRKEASDPAA